MVVGQGVQMILRACQISARSCNLQRVLRNHNLKTAGSARLITTSTCNTSAAQHLERKYTDKHEWVTLDGKIGTVGITHYAQDALGDVVYAQLPDVGTVIAQHDECGALESVKAASELYCPISGCITEKNTCVEETPALINQSCYDKGWLFKIEVSKPEELTSLMNEVDYDKFLKSDPH